MCIVKNLIISFDKKGSLKLIKSSLMETPLLDSYVLIFEAHYNQICNCKSIEIISFDTEKVVFNKLVNSVDGKHLYLTGMS